VASLPLGEQSSHDFEAVSPALRDWYRTKSRDAAQA
jgi:hypothetical protein